ncbi:hypothetical protein CC1G_00230 [Coprinopsis cinerea okayama7|uniref:RNase III domain-containing protein n=1 Tax=Coprinopsis cinerea (strain Okayama-7 / 130 / ATCC MYA-4618 / FGSC 9003) TaxID=240176 RepID=A8NX83_COPC7|nr:hypothetical protein CC1G_00230 [Coprinopsis cinerea okayama7\|eukprot:XP_001837094.2 hypothetical protein CC1G_00230 [Coprinopsis cinerea okayama7\
MERTQSSLTGKRSRKVDGSGPQRPAKHFKGENDESIRKRLPELAAGAAYAESDIDELRSSILDTAKHSNTIAYLPKSSNIDPICYDFLCWAVDASRSHPADPRRVSLFVVENESSLDAHALFIQKTIPDVICFTCTSDALKRDKSLNLLGHDVIVTTSQTLLELFSKDLVQLRQVQVVIIEDAQHVKAHDCYSFLPIVQFMRLFYSPCPAYERPRLFSLVLSPDLAQHPFDSRSLKLEITLHSKTYGVTEEKRTEIIDLPDRPNEVVVLYDKSASLETTFSSLPSQLRALDPKMTVIRKRLHEAELIETQIGPCAAELWLKMSLEEFGRDMPVSSEAPKDDVGGTKLLEARICEKIRNWSCTPPELNPSSPGFNVTHKFLRFLQALDACLDYGAQFRAVIFVQRKSTALALAEIIKHLPDGRFKFISPCSVFGKSRLETQQETFTNFASGVYNLLVVTRSAMELDIPKATVVVRFDLMDSQFLYGQIKACARGRESHLIHLVERHNDSHRRILSNAASDAERLFEWFDGLRDPEGLVVPPANLKESSMSYYSESDEDIDKPDYVSAATTGGRLYPQDAIVTLVKFASYLREQGYLEAGHSLFEYQSIPANPGQPLQFACKISLPGTPVDGMVSAPEMTKTISRRAAAFSACKRLASLGLLDYRIVPLPSTPQVLGPSATNPTEKGTRRYFRKQPEFWKHGSTGPVSVLHPMVICVEGNAAFGPLLLFTRQPMPSMPSFNLFSNGDPVKVAFHRGSPFKPEPEEMDIIYGFTLRLVKMCLNKPVTCPVNEATYFFGALSRSWAPRDTQDIFRRDIAKDIDWELMSRSATKWAVPITISAAPDMQEDLADAVIQDRFLEFTRRYHVVKLRQDMTPMSKPVDSKREQGTKISQFLKSASSPPWRIISIRRTEKEGHQTKGQQNANLIPELCAKCTIPASMFRTSYLIPSILWKLDHLFVVKELNMQFFDNAIDEELLYMATTTVSAEMEHNYERLELLGDAFLKYLASVVVFVMNPTQNEGSLHVARQRLISNKALLACATQVGLPAYICSKPFLLRGWRPWPSASFTEISKAPDKPGTGVAEQEVDTCKARAQNESAGESQTPPSADHDKQDSDQEVEEGAKTESSQKKRKRKKWKDPMNQNLQNLGDKKAIADVTEAIIGAAYVSGGRETALDVAKALSIPIPGINTWSDLGMQVVIPFTTDAIELRPGSIEAVEGIIGHRFQQPHLLAQILTHTSVHGSKVLTYERLEFIGDAILDFMVIRHIFDRERTLSPGGLTMLKGAMVANSTLATVCILSGIYKHLVFGSYQLSSAIEDYAEAINERADKEYALAEQENRMPGQFWPDIEPPKALSDVIESIIGALYISDNFCPVGTEAFFDKVLRPFFDKHISLRTLTHHPTKTLFEYIQAHGCQQLKLSKGPQQKGGKMSCEILVHETVCASASDVSLSVAAREASTRALDRFKEDGDFLFKLCDCRTGGQNKGGQVNKGFEHALSSLEQGG